MKSAEAIKLVGFLDAHKSFNTAPGETDYLQMVLDREDWNERLEITRFRGTSIFGLLMHYAAEGNVCVLSHINEFILSPDVNWNEPFPIEGDHFGRTPLHCLMIIVAIHQIPERDAWNKILSNEALDWNVAIKSGSEAGATPLLYLTILMLKKNYLGIIGLTQIIETADLHWNVRAQGEVSGRTPLINFMHATSVIMVPPNLIKKIIKTQGLDWLGTLAVKDRKHPICALSLLLQSAVQRSTVLECLESVLGSIITETPTWEPLVLLSMVSSSYQMKAKFLLGVFIVKVDNIKNSLDEAKIAELEDFAEKYYNDDYSVVSIMMRLYQSLKRPAEMARWLDRMYLEDPFRDEAARVLVRMSLKSVPEYQALPPKENTQKRDKAKAHNAGCREAILVAYNATMSRRNLDGADEAYFEDKRVMLATRYIYGKNKQDFSLSEDEKAIFSKSHNATNVSDELLKTKRTLHRVRMKVSKINIG